MPIIHAGDYEQVQKLAGELNKLAGDKPENVRLSTGESGGWAFEVDDKVYDAYQAKHEGADKKEPEQHNDETKKSTKKSGGKKE